MTGVSPAEKLRRKVCAAYPPAEIPALSEQYERWRETKPLARLRLLDATPLYLNTCAKLAVLLAGGAGVAVSCSSRIPYNAEIVRFLEGSGIPVLRDAAENPGRYAGSFDIVLDCGGVHAEMETALGAVELTRSGVTRYEQSGKNVFLADSGLVKTIETGLGTGESCLRALQKLGHGSFRGKNVLVLGGGKVGHGLAWRFSGAGAAVRVADLPGKGPLFPGCEAVDFRDENSMRRAIFSASLIVSATGLAGAHTALAGALVSSDALLVNMGLEDEFGPDVPETRVLNRKKPLNFILDEPTLTRYIDPAMALDNEGALILAGASPGRGVILPEKALEQRILSIVRERGLIREELDGFLPQTASPGAPPPEEP